MKRVLVIGLVLGLLATACARARDERSKVFDFITNTESLPREFTYTVKDDGERIVVRGEVEDSLRYHAFLNLKGKDVAEIVIDDDALALRAIDATQLPPLAQTGASQVVIETLNAGQWVVDPSGAPPIRAESTKSVQVSQNVVQEATNALRYVRQAIGDAREVKEWREEDLEPAYRPSEDKFPKPRESQLRRFDLVRPPVPKPTQQLGALEEQPTAGMFRRMAIYVTGNRVVRVIEQIDIDGHPDFVEARKEKKKRMLEFLDQIKGLQGTQAINEREMSLVFKFTSKTFQVRQPQEGLRANLKGIFSPASNETEQVPADEPEQQNDATPSPPATSPTT
jgi:hypothetical protein